MCLVHRPLSQDSVPISEQGIKGTPNVCPQALVRGVKLNNGNEACYAGVLHILPHLFSLLCAIWLLLCWNPLSIRGYCICRLVHYLRMLTTRLALPRPTMSILPQHCVVLLVGTLNHAQYRHLMGQKPQSLAPTRVVLKRRRIRRGCFVRPRACPEQRKLVIGERMRAKQSCGDPGSLCRYTQGRYISSSFIVNLDPCPGQGKKLWCILRVYLDPEIDSYCCRTITASSKKK